VKLIMKGQVVPQPQVVMAQPMMQQAQPMQAQPMQGQMMQQPMQGQMMQAQPMQGQMMQAQPMQGQMMQAQPMQGQMMQQPVMMQQAQPVQGQLVQGQVMQQQPVMQQQMMQPTFGPQNPITKQAYPAPSSGQWTTGMFGCFEDIPICCYGMCCGYCLFGAVASHIKPGGCCGPCFMAFLIDAIPAMVGCPAMGCFYTTPFRTLFRSQFGLPVVCCSDFFAHCCCYCCAFTQEAREISARIKQANHPSEHFGMCGSNGIF
jgi:Cys-rich protein (TIGR01571 family)